MSIISYEIVLFNMVVDTLLSSLLNPLEGVLNCGNMELRGAPNFQH
jgi:hypothetical protein